MALLIDGMGGSFFNIYVYQIIIIYTLPYNFVNHTSINLEEKKKTEWSQPMRPSISFLVFQVERGEYKSVIGKMPSALWESGLCVTHKAFMWSKTHPVTLPRDNQCYPVLEYLSKDCLVHV